VRARSLHAIAADFISFERRRRCFILMRAFAADDIRCRCRCRHFRRCYAATPLPADDDAMPRFFAFSLLFSLISLRWLLSHCRAFVISFIIFYYITLMTFSLELCAYIFYFADATPLLSIAPRAACLSCFLRLFDATRRDIRYFDADA